METEAKQLRLRGNAHLTPLDLSSRHIAPNLGECGSTLGIPSPSGQIQLNPAKSGLKNYQKKYTTAAQFVRTGILPASVFRHLPRPVAPQSQQNRAFSGLLGPKTIWGNKTAAPPAMHSAKNHNSFS
jgi:hypothetical protein